MLVCVIERVWRWRQTCLGCASVCVGGFGSLGWVGAQLDWRRVARECGDN